MPKIFLQEFGLDQYSNLDEISKNPNYFYDKMISNFNTKVYDETLYDIELKVANGNHIYIKDITGSNADWSEGLEEVTIHKITDDQGKVWRIDPITNEKLYALFSSDDKVYKVPNSNVEIIATSRKEGVNKKNNPVVKSGIVFYLNSFKYQAIHISDAIAAGKIEDLATRQNLKFDNILDLIALSKNRCAQQWVSQFRDVLLENTSRNVWREDRVEFNHNSNNFENIDPIQRNLLEQQAKEMHSSLLKSLEIIAARIPAQNQQSFMPMKVVAWENPNVNTAYVSVMQFFLQGSDLDIDAVSLLTHSFNKNGLFHEWSPDFNMTSKELLEESLNIPFPTGEKLKVVTYDVENDILESQKRPLLQNNSDYKELIAYEVYKRSEDFPTDEQQILALEKIALQHYINLLNFIENEGGIVYFENQEAFLSQDAQDMIKRINKHNTYLLNANDNISKGAIKNYLVSQLYGISTDAANMIEAHTGVDVATKPFKDIANQSELSKVQQTFTPGNVFNKFQAIEEASVGKDDIAICATGLKAFFASTQFCNDYLNSNKSGLNSELADIVSKIIKFQPVEIGGKRFNTLANIRVNNLQDVNKTSEIYKILRFKGFDEDASVIMSALLSLSTDNAKELCLAKINAGTNMMGMYLYGAAIGMDFEVLNQIIASPLGFTIAKLLNSNEFTQKKGKTSVDAALAYLYDGPGKDDLAKYKTSVQYNDREFLHMSNVYKDALEKAFNSLHKDSEIKTIILNSLNENETLNIDNLGKILSILARSSTNIYEVYNFLNIVNNKINHSILLISK